MSVSRALPCRLLAVFALLAAMAFMGACAVATADYSSSGPPKRVLNLPPDQAFEAALQAMKNMGYGIASQYQHQGWIKTSPKTVSIQGNTECGSLNGTSLKGTATFILMVSIRQYMLDQSLVTTRGLFEVRSTDHNKQGLTPTQSCDSLGVLENQYLDVLANLAFNWVPKKKVKQAEKKAEVPQTSATPPQAETKEPPKAPAQPKAAASAQDAKPEVAPAKTEAKDASAASPPAEQSENPKLQKLRRLKSMGLLSDQEFENEKAKMGLSGK